MPDPSTVQRASRHAALGDPIRLAIADELAISDRAPMELQAMFGLPSNLLSHHLDVLENVGLISRHRSSGDGRRRYVRLETDSPAETQVRLRFYRGDRGVVYIQAKTGAPELPIGLVDRTLS